MAYYIDLFSPETYEAFSQSEKNISGFRIRQEGAASRIKIGDKLICYMTKLGRWVGILEVESTSFIDTTPIFHPVDDPFIVRLRVKPIVWLPKEKALPIRDNRIWNNLSLTKGYDVNSTAWTGKFRSSLNSLDDKDGAFLENLILNQSTTGEVFEINQQEYEKLITHKVKRVDKIVTVTVPQENAFEKGNTKQGSQSDVRESIKMQALLSKIGAQMGMNIWLPRNDKTAVLSELKGENINVLEILPLNYDETTLKTIEQIDVIWLKSRSIVRAFEVEHTTSIYSGLLRMADLLALQPNMDIRLHIVAPDERRDKVFSELQRPVFSLLEKGPLSDSCTYLSYESVFEISKEKHLSHLSDSVLDEYAESAE